MHQFPCRRSGIWTILILASLLDSCGSSKKTTTASPAASAATTGSATAPATGAVSSPSLAANDPNNPYHLPDSLPPLPVSDIDIPFKVYGPPLLHLADSTVPKEFTSDKWPAFFHPDCELRYKYRFVRSPFQISATAGTVRLQWQGKYQIAGGRCVCVMGNPVSPWISGTCGFGSEALRRVDMALSIQLSLRPDYRLQTLTRLDQLKSLDRCVVSVVSSDITGQVADSIRSSVAAFSHVLDSTVSSHDLSGYLKQVLFDTWRKHTIGPYGYLHINPVQIRMGQLNYMRDTFLISAGISCRPELRSDDHGLASASLPPVAGTPNRDGVKLHLGLHYDYDFLTRALHDSLHGKSFVVDGNNFIIRDVAVRAGGNHQIEVRVEFAGSRKGKITIRGTPLLDTAAQTVSVPDISYTLESRELALKIARMVFRNKIRKSLKGSSYLDLAALLKTNQAALDSQLNRQIVPGLDIAGHFKQLRMTGLLAGDHGLDLQLYVDANLYVTASRLDGLTRGQAGRK